MIRQNTNILAMQVELQTQIDALPDHPKLVRMTEVKLRAIFAITERVHEVDLSLNEAPKVLELLDEALPDAEDFLIPSESHASLQRLYSTAISAKVISFRRALVYAYMAAFKNVDMQLISKFPEQRDEFLKIQKEHDIYLNAMPAFISIPQKDDILSELQVLWLCVRDKKTKIDFDLLSYLFNIDKEFIEYDENLGYTIHGNVNIPRIPLSEMPIKFNKVYGEFVCEDAALKNFNNFPNFIKGDLHISYNSKISSLSGLKNLIIDGKVYARSIFVFKFEFRIPKNLRSKLIWN